jgi:hypothetical protein
MNYFYFAARSDAIAADLMDRPDGQDLLADRVPGVQFSQEFGRFAELLTGEDVDFEDEEFIVAETDDGTAIVCRVPADLVRTIADADAPRLHALVPEWSEFEDFADPDPGPLHAFVDELQRLSRVAAEAGGGVYVVGWA